MFCGSHPLMGTLNQEHCLGNQIALEILSCDNKSHCGIAISVVLGSVCLSYAYSLTRKTQGRILAIGKETDTLSARSYNVLFLCHFQTSSLHQIQLFFIYYKHAAKVS